MNKIKIISGGQTGVDRAALDAALSLKLSCGGWSPKGRRSEDGVIPKCYPLREMPSPKYPPRTAKNVREADGTLILTWGPPTGGTALTINLARRQRKPYLVMDLARGGDPTIIREWLRIFRIETLNVAGPRESKAPGIQDRAHRFLLKVFEGLPSNSVAHSE
jgi:hypothetical protein